MMNNGGILLDCGLDFYAGGVHFRLTFGFLAVWAMILLQSAFSDTAEAAMAACLIHELGHIVAMKAMRVGIIGMTFYSGGIKLKSSPSCFRGTAAEIFILAAGPLANLVCAVGAAAMGFVVFAWVNTALMLFNLLPLSMLDGGRIIAAASERLCPLRDIRWAQAAVDIAFGGALTAFFLLSGSAGFSLPLTMGLIICEGMWERNGGR